VYSYSKSCYYEVVYVQGDNYLESYRQRVGDAAFWNGLRNYYAAYRFGLGGTRQLFDTLDEAAGGAGGGHEARFPSLYP
jgi:aminopeptidase N